MRTKLQLTAAQRRIRESPGKRSLDTARIAQHRIELPRVHESLSSKASVEMSAPLANASRTPVTSF